MLRQIDALKEVHLFLQAWMWGVHRPEWFQAAEAVDTPDYENWYVTAASGRVLNFGVWKDGIFCALIQYTETDAGIWEAHFDSDGSLGAEELADAIFTVGWELFLTGARCIFAWVAKQHRACQRICNGCQLFWDGARRLKGSYKGKPIEWLRLTLSRERWEKLRDEGAENNTDRATTNYQFFWLHESPDDGSDRSRQELQVSG